MALQFSILAGNARLDAIETYIGALPILRIYSGSPPALTTTAASGTLLAEMTLPSDWMNAGASRSKTKLGTWQETSANAAGTAGYFRILESTGTTTAIQGTVTATAGGGDMTLDNAVLALAQVVTVNTFTLTDGNA